MVIHPERMSVLALCAGIGGLELGMRIANPTARCVCYVEGDAYAASVLVGRMEEKSLHAAPIWSNVVSFDGKPWRGKVDCITGGYPCQPFSTAGKQLGKDDPRWLWPSIARIIREIEPQYCFFENVSAHLRMGFEQVHDELREMGYRVAAGLFTAAEVGAGHKRERLFLLADAVGEGRRTHERTANVMDGSSCPAEAEEHEFGGLTHALDDGGPDVESGPKMFAHWPPVGMVFPPSPDSGAWRDFREIGFTPATTVESDILGMADGIAARMDRLRCSGNAVCPLVAAYAFGVLRASLLGSESAEGVS